ncbi:hypothetical protein [Halorussus sp. MSC15.2]|uniref:hypothetical protein n=1 Tax=Halorussus sp. MSC15.2 TaxID=2283638 RepID=UPI0013D874BE|nr:hypothetical protein [Halorussus sp. MSC15.2]NEU58788.1 hypothetical protein [Halorussus sp. MSC15.2]
MKQSTRRAFLGGVGTTALSLPLFSSRTTGSLTGNELPGSRPLKDRVGVTHVGGGYHFTTGNFLNEGAKRIRDLGSRVIKVWFHHVAGDDPYNKYPYNSEWPASFASMVDIAESNYFRELFQRDFRTFTLVAYAHVDGGYGDGYKHYFIRGVTDEQLRQEEQGFYELTKHLLETYRGTGKEFVLQHWQGDWAILRFDERKQIKAHQIADDDIEPTQTAIDGMVQWLNARQRGVERARTEISSDVTVLHAAEINMAIRAMKGQKRVINSVIPETNVDLVSHNSYTEMWAALRQMNPNEAPAYFQSILDYVNENTPNPSQYVESVLPDPNKNVFVGEYGLPFAVVGEEKATQITKLATHTSLDWGVPYTIFWEIYDNEGGKGFWLVRPDGTKTAAWDYFNSLITENALQKLLTYTELVLKFNKSVETHEINPDISKDKSRPLTFRCSELDLLDSKGQSFKHYDIGRFDDEPILTSGTSYPESNDRRSWRWFVAEDNENPRTVIYIERSMFNKAEGIRIRGYPVTDAVEADVLVDGQTVDQLNFDRDRGWTDYSVELQMNASTTGQQSVSATPSTTTQPTTTGQRTRPNTKSVTSNRNGSSVPGFGISAATTGLATALARYWIKSDSN